MSSFNPLFLKFKMTIFYGLHARSLFLLTDLLTVFQNTCGSLHVEDVLIIFTYITVFLLPIYYLNVNV